MIRTFAHPARAVRRARPAGVRARRSPPAARRRTTRARRAARRARPSRAAAADPDAEIKEGLKTVSIPKQLGNPYEEFEHSGVDEALKELGGSNRISGPTDAGASSQVSIINAAVQQKPDAIIIAGNDPNAVAPALKQAAQQGVKVVGMDSDVAPDARSVFINQVTTELVGKNQVESIAKQIGNKGEIAILSATANATNQNAWIKVMKETLKEPEVQGHQAREGRLRRRRRPEVLPGDAGPDPGLSEPQGHHLADHGRRRRRRALPVDLAAEGQGQADRARLPEPDAQVRQGRHASRSSSCGCPRTSATSPARPPRRSSPGASPARRARSSRPAGSASYTIGANGEIVLGPLTTFNKDNIDDFDF